MKDDFVTERMQSGILTFEYGTQHFESTVHMDQPGYVSFSVPFAKGFSAFVDGTPCKILSNNHLMAVPVPKGEHIITFRYRNPAVIAGLICSCIGWIIRLFLFRGKHQ